MAAQDLGGRPKLAQRLASLSELRTGTDKNLLYPWEVPLLHTCSSNAKHFKVVNEKEEYIFSSIT